MRTSEAGRGAYVCLLRVKRDIVRGVHMTLLGLAMGAQVVLLKALSLSWPGGDFCAELLRCDDSAKPAFERSPACWGDGRQRARRANADGGAHGGTVGAELDEARAVHEDEADFGHVHLHSSHTWEVADHFQRHLRRDADLLGRAEAQRAGGGSSRVVGA